MPTQITVYYVHCSALGLYVSRATCLLPHIVHLKNYGNSPGTGLISVIPTLRAGGVRLREFEASLSYRTRPYLNKQQRKDRNSMVYLDTFQSKVSNHCVFPKDLASVVPSFPLFDNGLEPRTLCMLYKCSTTIYSPRFFHLFCLFQFEIDLTKLPRGALNSLYSQGRP